MGVTFCRHVSDYVMNLLVCSLYLTERERRKMERGASSGELHSHVWQVKDTLVSHGPRSKEVGLRQFSRIPPKRATSG